MPLEAETLPLCFPRSRGEEAGPTRRRSSPCRGLELGSSPAELGVDFRADRRSFGKGPVGGEVTPDAVLTPKGDDTETVLMFPDETQQQLCFTDKITCGLKAKHVQEGRPL